MTASPAQVANDLTAQGAFFARRDEALARACRDAAAMIRQHLRGERVTAEAWAELDGRLGDLIRRHRGNSGTVIAGSLARGRLTLEELWAAS